MDFRLLGPLEASDGNGNLPLGGPKQRTVLAHLLLRANRVVTTERLIDALWGDEPPDTARNTIQTCWLYQFPGFAVNFVPKGSLGRRMGVFPFPAIDASTPQGMLGGGVFVGAFSDRPEVREVVRFLLGPDFGKSLVTVSGNMSPNRRFDTSNHAPAWRPTAEALKAALAADTFRFDASDLMPGEVGGGAFWKGMLAYARGGPESLDGILRTIDAAWPNDG